MFAVFDVADRNQCDVRTHRTNTPLQALVTLNEPSLAACAQELGQRARERTHAEAEQLRRIWLACTGRNPDAMMVEDLKMALGRYRKLADGDEEQAWLALANVMLNLDATLTLE